MKKKTWVIVILAVAACLCAVWTFIHRRVIRAAVKGEPMPECPHWLPACLRGKFGPEAPREAE